MLFKPFILTLDASGAELRLELGEGGSAYHYDRLGGDQLHEKLLTALDKFFHKHAITPDRLGAVAVNQGPGHYNRLRVSLTWAKTSAYCLNIPLLGYDGFTVLDNYLRRVESFVSGDISLPSSEDYDKDFDKKSNLWEQLSVDFQKKKSNVLTPLKVYLYRVSPNRFFSCVYWKGKRVGRVTHLDEFPYSPYIASSNSIMSLLNINHEVSLSMRSDIGEYIDLLCREKGILYFLYDGGLKRTHSNDDTLELNGSLESMSTLSLNQVETELNKLHKPLSISVYHCVLETIKNKSLDEFQSGAMEVNPKYFREFGE